MRLIDADDFVKFEKEVFNLNTINDITAKTVFKQIMTDAGNQPTVEAIPIDFIESEKRFVSELSSKAYESGNIERAKGLSNIALNLDALISNWGFIRGDEWRENRKKAKE